MVYGVQIDVEKNELKAVNIRQQHNKMWEKMKRYEYFRKARWMDG